MCRSAVIVSLAIALVVTARPASAGPVGFGSDAAPAIGESIERLPGVEDVPFESLSAPQAVRCAWPAVVDDSAPDTGAELYKSDLGAPENPEDGFRLAEKGLDCSHEAAADVADVGQAPPPQRASRVGAVFETVVIVTSMLFVLGLGWLVAAMARGSGGVSLGLRRRL
jgi:hypothetical protein